MKVLHVIPSFYPAAIYGGLTESVYQLCRHLLFHGCEIRVLTTDANGLGTVLDVPTAREVGFATGWRVRYCHRLAGDAVSPALLRWLSSSIRWADVVHLTTVYSFPTIPTLFLCKILGKPVVWSPTGALQRWQGSTRRVLKICWESVCRIAVPKRLLLHATSVEEAHESAPRFPGAETVCIPYGVEIPQHVAHVERTHTLRLLYLGRLHPKKGIENLLEACHRLKGTGSVLWMLTLAGAGGPHYTETLRSRIRMLGLSEEVQMVGLIFGCAKRTLFEHADIVLVPSYTESFGMVVAEALAHGVPVIVSRGAPWKRVEEVGCGLWVENDRESLAEAVTRMSVMPLSTMGHRGREWMEKEFSWDLMASALARRYAEIMGRE